MAVVWNKTLFDQAYSESAEPEGHPNTREGIRLHYNRAVQYAEAQKRAAFYVQQFGLNANSHVLIVGCGFGWTVEALISLGIDAIGTDTSAYIQGNKTINEDAEIQAAIFAVGLDPASGEGLVKFNAIRGNGVRTNVANKILNESHSNNSSRNRVKQAIAGGVFTLVISEDIVTSLTDAECATVRNYISNYSTPIAHLVTVLANPNPPFNFNSKTLVQWKAMFPNDTIVGDGTYEVM